MSERAPLLSLEDLRVDVDGVPAVDGLGFETHGERIVVLGAPQALFAAASGLARVLRGRLSIRGVLPAVAVTDGLLASAAMDPPMPPRFTVREYVAWSARIAGADPAEVDEAIAKLRLGPMAKTAIEKLVPHARRATVAAAALATGAEAIVLEDPLGGLADDVAKTFGEILCEALEGRAWIVLAPRLPIASALALAADEATIVTARAMQAQGPPAEIAATTTRYVLRLGPSELRPEPGPAEAIAAAVAAEGGKVVASGDRLLVELGPALSPGEIVTICANAGVAVVELVPVARALS